MGYSHVKAFHQKILRPGSHFGQKYPYRSVTFHLNCEQLVKSTVSGVEKPLEVGPDLQKIKEKNSQISHCLREKNPKI